MENTDKKNFKFTESDAFPGILLLIATIIALIFANTPLRGIYERLLYEIKIGEEFNLHFFINDFLMAIFFLVVGFEIKRELVYGKLSSIKQASFPIIAAIGGMTFPALIFTFFNYDTPLEIGVGIPLSTDIAFAIGLFSILKNKLNKTLEVFLLTLAVVDDLLSIVIIGVFYSLGIKKLGLFIALGIILIILAVRKYDRTNKIYVYMFLGLCLWAAILYSGVHSTISGVILAFCMPIFDEDKRHLDLSYKLQHKLEGISNQIILPLFAFANTGIVLGGGINLSEDLPLMLGIILGLSIGKPVGIMLFSYIGYLLKISNKPKDATWYDVFVVAVIAGIGFTMSLFISEIAFQNEAIEITESKISILISSVISTILSVIFAFLSKRQKKTTYK